mmetsp:Transcript_17473/g.26402  ORF Transcript_17473/g.26402 Transcript_17473/m.26402 type:complete len:336 (-) Transcript_17473:151-1158(-)
MNVLALVSPFAPASLQEELANLARCAVDLTSRCQGSWGYVVGTSCCTRGSGVLEGAGGAISAASRRAEELAGLGASVRGDSCACRWDTGHVARVHVLAPISKLAPSRFRKELADLAKASQAADWASGRASVVARRRDQRRGTAAQGMHESAVLAKLAPARLREELALLASARSLRGGGGVRSEQGGEVGGRGASSAMMRIPASIAELAPASLREKLACLTSSASLQRLIHEKLFFCCQCACGERTTGHVQVLAFVAPLAPIGLHEELADLLGLRFSDVRVLAGVAKLAPAGLCEELARLVGVLHGSRSVVGGCSAACEASSDRSKTRCFHCDDRV